MTRSISGVGTRKLPDSFDDPLTQHPVAARDFVRDM